MKRLRKYTLTLVATTSLVTVVLLATGWGSAMAAQVTSVFVTNTPANPVPVAQQGTANVNVTNTVPVAPQGTANVNVTNSSLAVAPPSPITSGGGNEAVAIVGLEIEQHETFDTVTASALVVHMQPKVNEVKLDYNGQLVARFFGPSGDLGPPDAVLALTRPIRFNGMTCSQASYGLEQECTVNWVGNQP